MYNQDIKELEKYGEDLREHYEKAKVTHKKVKEFDEYTNLNCTLNAFKEHCSHLNIVVAPEYKIFICIGG